MPWPQLAGSHAVDALPALFAPLIAGTYGALVELDNTGDEGGDDEAPAKRSKRARVELDDDLELDAAPRESRKTKKKKRA